MFTREKVLVVGPVMASSGDSVNFFSLGNAGTRIQPAPLLFRKARRNLFFFSLSAPPDQRDLRGLFSILSL